GGGRPAGPRGRGRPPPPAGGDLAPVGQDRERAARPGGEAVRPRAQASGAARGGHRVVAGEDADELRAPWGGGGPGPGGAAVGTGSAGRWRGRGERAPGGGGDARWSGVRVPRPGLAVGGDGAGADGQLRGVQGADGGLRASAGGARGLEAGGGA